DRLVRAEQSPEAERFAGGAAARAAGDDNRAGADAGASEAAGPSDYGTKSGRQAPHKPRPDAESTAISPLHDAAADAPGNAPGPTEPPPNAGTRKRRRPRSPE